MNDYKKIVLLKGLEGVEDYQFRMIKSILRKELNLTKKMQDEYDRIQISDLMEDKYPEDAGLEKLIEVCQSIKELEDRAKMLEKEKAKVKERKTLGKKRQEAGSAVPTSTTSNTLASDGEETATAQKRKTMNEEKPEVKKTKMSKGSDCPASPGEATVRCQTPGPQISSSTLSNSSLAKTQTPSQSATRGAVGQNDAMTVKVVSATEPFKYESKEHGENSMFHGTVATESEYFHVKVFNINLKEKFTKGNVIIISNYVKFRGILEIKKDSFVVNADPKQKIEVPNKLIRRANETPKISDIHKGISGALFYGLFTLYKKKVNPKRTIYEIKDDTGNIEVLGKGNCYNVSCEEGDKLRLFCFQLKTIDKQLKLVSGDHSFIKVTKAGKKKISAVYPNPKEARGYPQN